jgi:TRAP-type C4-dicarboxylate transport system substrate-binding protein
LGDNVLVVVQGVQLVIRCGPFRVRGLKAILKNSLDKIFSYTYEYNWIGGVRHMFNIQYTKISKLINFIRKEDVMKKTSFLLVVFIGVGLLLMGGLPVKESAAEAKIVIKAVTAWPVTHVGNDYYKKFIERVNDRAKGELEIKLIGGPEVVSVFDQLKAVSTGTVDMSHGSQDYYAGIVPEGSIPGLAKHKNQLKAFRESGIWETYVQAYLERGKVAFLGNLWIGMPFYIMTNKPVSKLDDVKGLKLRGVGGLGDVIFGELGVSAVKIASAETYEGLQRGVVDGALRNVVSLVEFKEYEVMKYIIYPSFYAAYGGVYMGEKKWDSIPKNLQTMIKEVMIETEVEANKYYEEMDKARLKEVQEKHGMKVIYLSDKDIAKLDEAHSSPAIKSWISNKAPKYGLPIYEKMLPYIK